MGLLPSSAQLLLGSLCSHFIFNNLILKVTVVTRHKETHFIKLNPDRHIYHLQTSSKKGMMIIVGVSYSSNAHHLRRMRRGLFWERKCIRFLLMLVQFWYLFKRKMTLIKPIHSINHCHKKGIYFCWIIDNESARKRREALVRKSKVSQKIAFLRSTLETLLMDVQWTMSLQRRWTIWY